MAKQKKLCKNCSEIRRCAECKDNYGRPICKTMQGRLSLRMWSLIVICFFGFIGILGPFTAECILPFFFPEKELKTLNHWNQYVGIVLGSVATILSIVSLAMAFHNMDEAYAQQRTNNEQNSNMIQRLQLIEQSMIKENKLEAVAAKDKESQKDKKYEIKD